MQFLNISNFFQIELKDVEFQIDRYAISALCNLETFRNTFETSSDLKEIPENTNDTCYNSEKVMENSEKDIEQDKTSQSGQTNQNPVNRIEKEKAMLIDASELKNVSRQNSGNQLKGQNFFKENDIINFSVEDNILWKK